MGRRQKQDIEVNSGCLRVTEQLAALTAFCVDNPELDQLEAMLAEFNLFEAAGLTNQEIRHSRFLSFLLDPKGAQGGIRD
jgi:hypothetical protein